MKLNNISLKAPECHERGFYNGRQAFTHIKLK